MIGGDDFSNEGTWGVKSAVSELFVKYDIFEIGFG